MKKNVIFLWLIQIAPYRSLRYRRSATTYNMDKLHAYLALNPCIMCTDAGRLRYFVRKFRMFDFPYSRSKNTKTQANILSNI